MDTEHLPEISVIVPVYNVAAYLGRCIRSLTDQSFTNFEVLLIDDGSDDDSGALCDTAAASDPRFIALHKANGGLSDARNYGIDRARGKKLLFLDSDDYLEPDALNMLNELMEEYDADEAIGGVRNVYEGREITADGETEIICADGVGMLGMQLGENKVSASSCGKLMRAETLRGQRFPVGKVYEDAFFLPGYMLEIKKAVATTKPLYNYYHRLGSITVRPYSAKDMDTIEAYRYTYDTVSERCPEVLPQAECRLFWAHFVVLDKMMAAPDYKKIPEYNVVVRFLRKNLGKILASPYLTKSRKIAAIALGVSSGLYKLLSKAHTDKMRANAS